MANEIWCFHDEGATLYALIFDKDDDKVWNNTDETWDTYTDDDIDKYDIVLANQGTVGKKSDYYSVDFPAAITDEGTYRVVIMLQVGGSIDADDDEAAHQGEIHWDGEEEINLMYLNTRQNMILNIYDDTCDGDGGATITSLGRLVVEGGDC